MLPTALWRFLALAGAVIALVFVALDSADVGAYTNDHLQTVRADGRTYGRLRLIGVGGSAYENGGLRTGDVIAPLGPDPLREVLAANPAGTAERWLVERGAQRFVTTTHVTASAPDDVTLAEIFNVVRFAMLLVGIVVAVRRPEERAARALVTFLLTMGLTLVPGATWLPDRLLLAWNIVRGPIQIFSLAQGLLFACIFPFTSERGLRRALQKINPWYALVTAVAAFGLEIWQWSVPRFPDLGALPDLIEWSPLAYFFAIAVAFWIAGRAASGRDRQRVYWAAGSICAGFSGPLLATILYVGLQRTDVWMAYLALTLVAMPLGLAYTILRHRTIDVGFVISRALVLTILSAAIVLVFGLAERALGKIFIDASHVESRSVEIALALGLGFSLRSLHARIERAVDFLFFRRRRRSLAALRAFGDDVYFITDPDVAIERTIEVVHRCADADNAAVYLIADGVFGCAAAVDVTGFPSEVDENDPLFVRLRATRRAEPVADVPGCIAAEIAFPMFVRATLVGALVLTAKQTGEAYDPEEKALLSDLAQRVALALDALQTAVLLAGTAAGR